MIRALTAAGLTLAGLAVGVAVPAVAEAGTCTGFAYATPFKPGKVSQGDCGNIGSPGATVTYHWEVGYPSDGRACVEGWGYEKLTGPYTATQPRYVGRWYSLGCGTSGGGTVPWGDNLAKPKVRAQSQMVPLGVPINWQA